MMCYVVLEVLWGSAALTKSLFITEIKLRLILLDSLLQGFRLTRQQLWPIGGGPRDLCCSCDPSSAICVLKVFIMGPIIGLIPHFRCCPE